jgi:hypothetical protein
MNARAQATDASANKRSLAEVLRWVGAGAVLLSGLVYMLHGIREIGTDARMWVYPGLMLALAGGGVVSRNLMSDAKGARLFFGLAGALVPIQFSQLAGMFHELYGMPAHGPMPALLDYAGTTHRDVLAVGAATLCIALPVAFAAFSVLTRIHARRLTWVYLGLCAAMLLTPRASAAGIAIIAALAAASVVIERWLAGAHPAYRTGEGVAVRAMLLAPLAIVAGRAAFHVDSQAGYCALGAMTGILLVHASALTTRATLRGFLQLAGLAAGAISWLDFATTFLHPPGSAVSFATAMLPVAVLALGVSRSGGAVGSMARFVGSSIVVLVALMLVFQASGVGPALLANATGAALVAWGVVRREHQPTIAGSAVVALSGFSLLQHVVEAFDLSNWLVLGGIGVVCLLCSSAVERYGKRALIAASATWTEVRTWT